MSRKWTRWGFLLGLFLCAAMHATSAMADSGWCPQTTNQLPTYSASEYHCQNIQYPSELSEYPAIVVIAPCHVCCESSTPSYTTGSWAIGIYNSIYNSYGPDDGAGNTWYCFSSTSADPAKGNGSPTCHTCVGDPINAGNGNVYRREEDFHAGRWLSFARFYNSDPSAGLDAFGQHWRHSYSSHVSYVAGATAGTGTATIAREDGRVSTYAITNGVAVGEPDIFDALTELTDSNGNPTGWTLERVDTRSTEQFDVNGHLTATQGQDGFITTLTYSTTATPTSVAPGAGYLITVTDPSQRSIQLTYNASGLINHVTAPDGSGYTYVYSGANLSSVTYPDGKMETYLYNESPNNGGATNPALLTGILDESNVRFQSYSYNASGLGTNDQRAGGVASYTVTYNSDGSADVLDPLGTSRHHGMTSMFGVPYVTSVNGTCESCSPTTGWAYDFNGQLNQSTDFNGNVTTYQHDGEGLLTGTVEGSGSSAPRSIQTDWNDTLHVPTERRWLDFSYSTTTKTDWVYNARGQALAECRIDMSVSAAASYACAPSGTPPAGVRRTSYTYCDAAGSGCPLVGLLRSVDGPRTDVMDVTTYNYYASSSASGCGTPGSACHQLGDLYQVTDALGHVTTYASYDGAGRVTRITDANGVNTDMTYSPRGWLASRSVGGAATGFTYMPYGEIQTVTDPDGYITTYGYDPAHRLTDIYDAQNNDLHYTLNPAGQKTGEQVLTASGTSVRNKTSNFNALGQLTSIVDGLGQTVFNASAGGSYDLNGNLELSVDGRGFQRQLSYDALNRLVTSVENYNGTDTATNNTTTQTYLDAQDRVTSVTDPRTYVTNYTYDGLSNATGLQSPDSGTSSSTFDAAGNALTHTDAKGTVATSAYDALNRRTNTSYPSTVNNVSYDYDESNSVTGCSLSSPIGRLTRIVENAVTTTFCYDARGNVIQKKQLAAGVTDSTSYGYTTGDRLQSENTPDHTLISYAFNSDGRISGVQVTPSGSTSSPPTVVSKVTWMPFGPIAGYTLGNGLAIVRRYDANYRMTDQTTSTSFMLHFSLDPMGDITAKGASPGANPASETYQYDPLYRLTTVTSTTAIEEAYTYNRVGDRLTKTASGLATGTYFYTSGTHQLSAIGNVSRANDLNGNTTGSVIGAQTYGFSYNGRQRITLTQANGSTVGTFVYNALGQRVYKVTPNIRFNYDQAGHILASYGSSSRDYVWLGDLPVALVDNTTSGSVTSSTVNYVLADGLNTPRQVTNSAGAMIWGWPYAGNPFGEQPASSSSGYVLNLRYPGQYFDAETGTNYNMARTYEPATGRYLQSDPKGLFGGQISTYAYGNNNPLSNIDPTGMDDTQCTFNRASCGWPPSVSTDSNVSVGLSETGAVAVGVETTGWGIAVDSTPNMCFYGSVAGTVGTAAGVYKGAGIDASLGTGALSDGDSVTAVAGFTGGEGAAAGGTIQYDPINNQVSAARGFLGAGEGAWAGILANKTHYYCVRKPTPKPVCPGKP